jgi:hypothetical protein
VLADSDIDYGVQRAIVVTRFAVLDFHRVLSGGVGWSDALSLALTGTDTWKTGLLVPTEVGSSRNEKSVELTRGHVAPCVSALKTVKIVLMSRQAPGNEQGITLSRDCNLRV